jgi:hypothetical protein
MTGSMVAVEWYRRIFSMCAEIRRSHCNRLWQGLRVGRDGSSGFDTLAHINVEGIEFSDQLVQLQSSCLWTSITEDHDR